MWVIGSGIPLNALYDLIKSRGWHREILLFDGFDDLQELIRVADLAIASNSKETLQYSLQMLAHAGVPMIVADSPDCRAWLPDSNSFQLYSTNQIFDLKLQDWLSNRERWTSMASSLRQNLRRAKFSDDCAQQWLTLFRDSSIERTA
jgi:glycosyltransferase involved in cell wall biosynthesis